MEVRQHVEPGIVPFTAQIDVTEPMGMETLVYFKLAGKDMCGRVNPKAGAKEGAPMQLSADLNNMHLIDEATGLIV
jgi:multiple sugar transport system ATP-binding protein